MFYRICGREMWFQGASASKYMWFWLDIINEGTLFPDLGLDCVIATTSGKFKSLSQLIS